MIYEAYSTKIAVITLWVKLVGSAGLIFVVAWNRAVAVTRLLAYERSEESSWTAATL